MFDGDKEDQTPSRRITRISLETRDIRTNPCDLTETYARMRKMSFRPERLGPPEGWVEVFVGRDFVGYCRPERADRLPKTVQVRVLRITYGTLFELFDTPLHGIYYIGGFGNGIPVLTTKVEAVYGLQSKRKTKKKVVTKSDPAAVISKTPYQGMGSYAIVFYLESWDWGPFHGLPGFEENMVLHFLDAAKVEELDPVSWHYRYRVGETANLRKALLNGNGPAIPFVRPNGALGEWDEREWLPVRDLLRGISEADWPYLIAMLEGRFGHLVMKGKTKSEQSRQVRRGINRAKKEARKEAARLKREATHQEQGSFLGFGGTAEVSGIGEKARKLWRFPGDRAVFVVESPAIYVFTSEADAIRWTLRLIDYKAARKKSWLRTHQHDWKDAVIQELRSRGLFKQAC